MINETAELFQIQGLLSSATEAAKECRNRFSVSKSLTSMDAADVANNLAAIGQEFHNLSVRMKQSSIRAAEQARRDIRQ